MRTRPRRKIPFEKLNVPDDMVDAFYGVPGSESDRDSNIPPKTGLSTINFESESDLPSIKNQVPSASTSADFSLPDQNLQQVSSENPIHSDNSFDFRVSDNSLWRTMVEETPSSEEVIERLSTIQETPSSEEVIERLSTIEETPSPEEVTDSLPMTEKHQSSEKVTIRLPVLKKPSSSTQLKPVEVDEAFDLRHVKKIGQFMYLKPPKIVKPLERDETSGLRRSKRTRLNRRLTFNEKPVYQRNKNGNLVLVGISQGYTSDPLLIKHKTFDKDAAMQMEKQKHQVPAKRSKKDQARG